MKFSEEQFLVPDLVEQFQKSALLVNLDYQRGAVWTERQQGKFVDSIFRGYPVPAIFLRVVENKGLRSSYSTFELIDGQQRLRALTDFLTKVKLRLPPLVGNGRLRLPAKVAAQPADWAGRTWTELSPELRQRFNETTLRVFVVEPPTSDDEVRDLFIRLQAGTALSRQQIRDAWPGPISPFVESLGGKGRTPSKSPLLSMIDKRGGDRNSEDDGQDPWVAHRQTCAQLLSVFLARERDPYARPRVSADDLDELYHETSEFDSTGDLANRFREALILSEQVLKIDASTTSGGRYKRQKVHIFAIFMVIQDIQHSRSIPRNDSNLGLLAVLMSELEEELGNERIRFSSPAISRLGEMLREAFFSHAGRLDPNRDFSTELQQEIWKRAQGLCQICDLPVKPGDAEYDHFPIPWAMCGPTTAENGRLVHATCHPRGRPRSQDRV